MKITKERLRQIIKEELSEVVNADASYENDDWDGELTPEQSEKTEAAANKFKSLFPQSSRTRAGAVRVDFYLRGEKNSIVLTPSYSGPRKNNVMYTVTTEPSRSFNRGIEEEFDTLEEAIAFISEKRDEIVQDILVNGLEPLNYRKS